MWRKKCFIACSDFDDGRAQRRVATKARGRRHLRDAQWSERNEEENAIRRFHTQLWRKGGTLAGLRTLHSQLQATRATITINAPHTHASLESRVLAGTNTRKKWKYESRINFTPLEGNENIVPGP